MNFEQLSLGAIGIDSANTGTPLQTWDTMLKEFGAYSNRGYIPNANHLRVEVTEDDMLVDDFVRTPMLELTNQDFDYVAQNAIPYDGMFALGDCGEVYQYDQFGAMFSLFGQAPKRRRTKRRRKKRPSVSKLRTIPKGQIRTIPKGKPRGLQQVIKQTSGGGIVKVKDTEQEVAIKLVKPMLESFNHYAKLIAPVAAIFPGYGPVIAQLAKLPKPGKTPDTGGGSMSDEGRRRAAQARAAWLAKKKKAERMRKAAIARRKAKERKKAERMRKAAIAKRKARERARAGGGDAGSLEDAIAAMLEAQDELRSGAIRNIL